MTTQPNLSTEPTGSHADLLRSVEGMLFQEARLLDEHRYDEWFNLWDKSVDICYWVPCNRDDADPNSHVSLIYDDRGRLEERIARLHSASAHAQDPRSRTARVVSNVEITALEGQEIGVVSVQTVGEFRKGIQTSYFSRISHRLLTRPSGISIKEKKVLLINNDGYLRNLTFLL